MAKKMKVIRKRPGRPKKQAPAIRLQVTMPPHVFDLLETQRGNMARSTYLQGLIYGRALRDAVVEGGFRGNGEIRGPIDDHTDEVCLTVIGKIAHIRLDMLPHKTRNPDKQCRCVVLPIDTST